MHNHPGYIYNSFQVSYGDILNTSDMQKHSSCWLLNSYALSIDSSIFSSAAHAQAELI